MEAPGFLNGDTTGRCQLLGQEGGIEVERYQVRKRWRKTDLVYEQMVPTISEALQDVTTKCISFHLIRFYELTELCEQ